jgi:hypothetical protein
MSAQRCKLFIIPVEALSKAQRHHFISPIKLMRIEFEEADQELSRWKRTAPVRHCNPRQIAIAVNHSERLDGKAWQTHLGIDLQKVDNEQVKRVGGQIT